jgi:hypothetical protein
VGSCDCRGIYRGFPHEFIPFCSFFHPPVAIPDLLSSLNISGLFNESVHLRQCAKTFGNPDEFSKLVHKISTDLPARFSQEFP